MLKPTRRDKAATQARPQYQSIKESFSIVDPTIVE